MLVRPLGAVAVLVSSLLLVPTTTAETSGAAAAAAPVQALVQVDQVGFAPGDPKRAYLMVSSPSPDQPFRVLTSTGAVALTGVAGGSRGAWNAAYPAVYPLDLSALRAPGSYHVEVGGLGAASPTFRVATRAELWRPRLRDVAAFLRAQRDGRHVIAGALRRKPSHLNDAEASVYDWPHFAEPDSDVIAGKRLTRLRGPVDVTGGWFDAGDFIKFSHTTAYADTLLLVAQRRLGRRAPVGLRHEIRFGLRWLDKAWLPGHGELVIQVGIGSGNRSGSFNGDHDVWRLPQRDDHLRGAANRYLRHRPVFVTDARPGRLAPNLAGRLAATYALAAQVDARRHRNRARHELALAADIFRRARTHGVHERDVVTALPHDFYPESAWRDDLELGAAELARAAYRLGDPRARGWLRAAGTWADGYLRHERGDTLNLYDVSALAHAEVLQAGHRAALGRPHLRGRLVRDLRRQLAVGAKRSAADPFAAGGDYTDFDVSSHTFGLVATAGLLHRVTGRHRYDALATRQRDWVLGANPWGVSMMIGVGDVFARCPQHVVANLSGGRDGTPPVLRGAVVNGPNSPSLFEGGLGEFFDNAPACPSDGSDEYAEFTGHRSRFVDDVRSWQTVEPAIDFTATAALAFALSSLG